MQDNIGTRISSSVSNSIILHWFSTFWWGDTAHENVFQCSYLESKTELNVAKAPNRTAQKKNVFWKGEHCRYFLMGRTIVVGKSKNWEGDTTQH